MAVAVTRTSKRPERPTLSPEKGRELFGLVLLGTALLLAGSFATFDPGDASLFHEVSQTARSHNWMGSMGAEIAAVGFGFFGVACFLVPVFLLVGGWRRLRRRDAPRVVGRGLGALLLLAAAPGLCQLLLGRMAWRGEGVPAGGAFGSVLTGLLDERLSFGGSLVALASTVAIGAALVVQSTLGEVLSAWRQRLALLWQGYTLARARRHERREKERARRRVITKHLQRVVEEKQEKQRREERVAPPTPAAAAADEADFLVTERGGGRIDLPLRVSMRRGEAPEYSLRRTGNEALGGAVGGDAPGAVAGDAVVFGGRNGGSGGGGEGKGASPGPLTVQRRYAAVAMAPAAAAMREAVVDTGLGRSLGSGPGPGLGFGESAGPIADPREEAPLRAPRPRPAPSPLLTPQLAPPAHQPAPQQPLPWSGEPVGERLPPVNLLQLGDGKSAADEAELVRLGDAIRSRCAEFGVEGSIEAISPGPVITVFEFQPAPGVKVSHIVNLQDDLALALKAESVRIERLPGRSTLGLEVPNRERGIIRLGSLLADERFRKAPSVLTMAIGTTIYGEPYYADLATMPHLLVAGATGAGKSVGLQSMITSILYKATRDEVQFIFIDPKRIELGVYADIPHLKAEVVVDPKKAANALRWAVAEMERRYRLLAEVHVRSIAYYNRAICDPEVRERLALSEEAESAVTAADLKPMPYYVVIIDELADLMMVSSSEVETSIARLAQMARAVGIHLIVATQRPSVDVLTGTIKANFPCRISYATASRHDSRTILDQVGSEKLLGRGDMLMMPPGSSRVIRLHGAYVSEQETASLVRWLKKQGKPELDPDVLRPPAEGAGAGAGGADNDDDLYDDAARLVVAERQASASFLQRRMRIGFSRAARLIDLMERDGLLGPPQGSKPREVLVKPGYFLEIDEERDGGADED
jgi:S-DNA-T family DNA segregation ATPase FtsK/SpoIIIE